MSEFFDTDVFPDKRASELSRNIVGISKGTSLQDTLDALLIGVVSFICEDGSEITEVFGDLLDRRELVIDRIDKLCDHLKASEKKRLT